jgi:hypothetical protein
MPKSAKVADKSELIQELQILSKQYQLQNPKAKTSITRKWYRQKSKRSSDFEKYFTDFGDFKLEANVDSDEFRVEKELSLLREENQELKSSKDKLIRRSISEEKLLKLYKEYLPHEFTYPIDAIRKNTKSNKDFVLNLSDIHLGERVIPEQVNYTNEYNKEVAIDRLNQLFSQLIKYAKKIIVKDLHIEMNGDILCGGIHQELARNNDLNEVESLFYFQKYFVSKLSELSKHFDNIYIDVIVGNHPRILQGKPYFKEKVQMNFEYILGRQLQMYYDLLREQKKNTKIFINVPESAFIVKKIKNTKFLITHGDILTGEGNGGFAGIPFYSICMSSAKFYGVLQQIGVEETTQFNHVLCGHLHTSAKIPLFNGGFCFVGGSVIGTNEFSLYKIKSVAKKEQLVLIIDDEGIDGEICLRLK